MRLILDFVDKYDDRVLYNNIDDLAIDDNVFLYHWCKCSHFVHKRQLKATISPDGYGVAYNYDVLGNLESIQPAQISGTGYTVNSTGEVEYEYDTANRLSKILTDTTVYNFTYDNFGKTSQIKAGSNLLASYTYNTSNGKLNTLTYGNGAKVRYEYDELDRIEKILYNANGESTYNVAYEYEYDSNGNIVCVTDNITGQTLQPQYDITGRVVSSVTVEDGKVISGTHVEYDEKSRISLYKYSFENPTTSYNISAQIVNTYLYNEDGTLWLSHATHGDYQSEISPDYDVFGRIKSKSNQVEIDYNDKFTVNHSYQYESSGRNLSYLVKKLTISINAVGSSTAKYNNSYDYEYNGNGYITGITETNSQNETKYYYDSKGQIIREDNGSINETIVWEYDSAGNIISKKRYDYTNNTTPTALRETVTYSYAANSDRLTSFGGQSITYDTIGNPLNYMGTTLEWEHGRELHKYGSYTYTYDANGIRINKSYTSNGTTYNTKYIVDGSRVMRQVWNSASGNYVCDYIYDENGMPMAFALSKNGGAYEYYFYETNIQGDIVGVYDANGDVIVRYKYTAYGEITNTPVQSSLLTSDFNQAILFRYRGYIYDSESGFYYLQSRYYDPEVGRFINADNQLTTGSDILGVNLFAYCGNNPVNRIDPNGEAWWHWALGATIVAACAIATVATAGGFAAALGAVASVSSGVAAATTASTVAAGAFIGSATVYGTAVMSAAFSSSSPQEFADQGNWGTVAATAGGAALGGAGGYVMSKAQTPITTGRGTQNPKVKAAVQNGQAMHKQMDYGPGVVKEKVIAPGCRVDGIDFNNRIIYELKPNNPQAIARGISQLKRYTEVASQQYGGTWDGILKLYN